MNLDSCVICYHKQKKVTETEIRELQISKVKFNLKGSVSHTHTSLLAVPALGAIAQTAQSACGVEAFYNMAYLPLQVQRFNFYACAQ